MNRSVNVQPYWVGIILAVIASAQVLGVAYLNYRTQLVIQHEVRSGAEKTERVVVKKIDSSERIINEQSDLKIDILNREVGKNTKGVSEIKQQVKELTQDVRLER